MSKIGELVTKYRKTQGERRASEWTYRGLVEEQNTLRGELQEEITKILKDLVKENFGIVIPKLVATPMAFSTYSDGHKSIMILADRIISYLELEE